MKEFSNSEIYNAMVNYFKKDDFSTLDKILKEGLDINVPYIFGMLKDFELFMDIEEMDRKDILSRIHHLCSLGLNINLSIGRYESPFWFSLTKGRFNPEEFAQLMALPGLDINITCEQGKTFLFYIHRYISYDDSCSEIEDKESILYPLVKIMVQQGADLTLCEKNGRTVMYSLADYPEVLTYLLEQGCDINIKDKKGISPFIRACQYSKSPQSYELAQIWFNSGVNINELYKEWPPLFHAISQKNEGFVKALVEKGYGLSFKSSDGMTAQRLAIASEDSEILNMIKSASSEEAWEEAQISVEQLNNHIYQQEWQAALEIGLSLEEKGEATSHVLDMISNAYRKLQDYEKALQWIKEAIDRYGIDMHLWDTIMITQVMSGQFQEGVDFWHANKESFKADEEGAGNMLAHLIVAFDQIGQPEKAIEEITPYIEIAKNTRSFRKGFLEYNMACMYGKTNDIEGFLPLAIEALEKDYKLSEYYEEADFAKVIDHPLFKLMVDLMEEEVLYHNMVKDDRVVTLYTRYNDQYDSISYSEGNYTTDTKEFSSKAELIKAYGKELSTLEDEGYESTLPDFKSIWIPAWDDIFKQIASETKGAVGEIRMEWDFSVDDDSKYHPLERPYYCYSDNGYDIDSYDDLLYVPRKHIFNDIAKEAFKLESFKALKKRDEVHLIQSEHDGGDEFSLSWKKNSQ